MQLELHYLAAKSLATGAPLPPRFAVLNRRWRALGVPAFLATLGILWAMVTKPQ